MLFVFAWTTRKNLLYLSKDCNWRWYCNWRELECLHLFRSKMKSQFVFVALVGSMASACRHCRERSVSENFWHFPINFDARHHHHEIEKEKWDEREWPKKCNKLCRRVSWTLKVKMNFGWSSTVFFFISRPISLSSCEMKQEISGRFSRDWRDISLIPFFRVCLFWSHNGNKS